MASDTEEITEKEIFLAAISDVDDHKCAFGSANRCVLCGKHRAPERATCVEIRVRGTRRQQLEIDV